LPTVRVFSLAKKLGLRSEALIAALEQMGVTGINAAAAIEESTVQAVVELLAEQAKHAREEAEAKAAQEAATAPAKGKEEVEEAAEEAEEWVEEPRVGRRGPEPVVGIAELERHIRELQQVETGASQERTYTLAREARRQRGERPATAVEAAPIVTVLGHVDHGKTTLLDTLRHTAVAAGEHGGITQHIGASELEHNGKRIVFIDTPGHRAFTAMRARGAQVTDLAVLVVAANDGVMPQTVEAIDHARAAGVPIIIAINKIDLPDADPTRVKQQLLEHHIVPEEWGGQEIVVEISALTGQGLENLLDTILLVAEMEQLWVDPEAPFTGVVIESSLDPAQGALATVLVRSGKIKVGDVVVAGGAHGRVRRLRDWRGRSVKEMEAGRPVSIVGLSEPPEAGEIVREVAAPKDARLQAEEFRAQVRQRELRGVAEVQLQELYRGLHLGETKTLNLVLKADVSGTLQALESSLMQLSKSLAEVEIDIVASGIGDITESDIVLAVASQAIVIGYNVLADDHVLRVAADDRVEVRIYNVIYQILEDIEKAAAGLLEPIYEEQFIGRAMVLQLFRISRLGVIAGARVTDGRMQRGARLEVKRGGATVYEGKLTSLRHLKDDVATVEAPNECGLLVADWRGWEENDVVEAYAQVEVERKLVTASAD
jgi:translation initiation factor IF-2